MILLLIGKEVGKDLMENLDRLVDRAAEFAASSVLMTAAVEIARTDIAYREIALRAARYLDAVGILAHENAPIDARDCQRLVNKGLGVATIVIEAFQFLFVERNESNSLIGKELHLLVDSKTLQSQAVGAEGVHRLVI